MVKNIRIKSVKQTGKKKSTAKKKSSSEQDFFENNAKLTPKPIKEERATIGFGRIFFLLLAALILGGLGSALTQQWLFPWLITQPQFAGNQFLQNATEQTTVIETKEKIISEVAQGDFSEGIDKASPSVVGIFQDDEQKTSGIIITGDGLIIAPATEITSEDTIFIRTKKGNEHEATVIDTNTALNLTLLRVEADNLPVITLADEPDLNLADTVIALRFELNAKQSSAVFPVALSSIVSTPVNEEQAAELLENIVETLKTPQVPKGFSLLISEEGELLGIQTLQQQEGDRSVFTSVQALRDIISMGVKGKALQYPKTGFSAITITKELQDKRDLTTSTGLLITAITEESNASLAGLQEQDIITEIDRQELDETANLAEFLQKTTKGDSLRLTVIRPPEEGTSEAPEALDIELILE